MTKALLGWFFLLAEKVVEVEHYKLPIMSFNLDCENLNVEERCLGNCSVYVT